MKSHPYISLYVFGSTVMSIGAMFNYSNDDRISGGFVIFGGLMIFLAITLGLYGGEKKDE